MSDEAPTPGNSSSSQDLPLPAEVLEKLDENQRQIVAASFMEAYAGPLPPPQVLAAYEDVVPGGAERIFARFEEQSSHRIAIEAQVVEADISAQTRGQYLASVVLLGFMLLAGYVASEDQSAAAVLIAASTLLAGAGAFLVGKKSQQKELEKRR